MGDKCVIGFGMKAHIDVLITGVSVNLPTDFIISKKDLNDDTPLSSDWLFAWLVTDNSSNYFQLLKTSMNNLEATNINTFMDMHSEMEISLETKNKTECYKLEDNKVHIRS